MKICVADDEREVRESIIYKLRTLFPNAQIFDGEFGTLAVERINIVRPDLVFVDIRMPEMDGLEILRLTKQKDPRVQVVVLSGFDDFEYARKALQLGASDYLLKPADREQLREVVDRVKMQMETVLLTELAAYMYHLPCNNVDIHSVRCLNTSFWFDERVWKGIWLGELNELQNQLEGRFDKVLMTFRFDQASCGVVFVTTKRHEWSFREKRDFPCALTAVMERWRNERFLGFLQTSQIVRNASTQMMRMRNQILSDSKAGNLQSLENSLDEWLGYLENMDHALIKKECTYLMAMLDEGLTASEIVVVNEEKLRYWSEWVEKHPTWNELKGQMQYFVLDGISELISVESQSNLNWFDHALHVVTTSKDPNMSLESVAEAVGVHPVTLSRIFKQHTGITFVRYLTRAKLRHAQSLLLQTDKKISEISEEIGYIDHHHFRNLFKNEYGVTPSEYRKRYGSPGPNDEW